MTHTERWVGLVRGHTVLLNAWRHLRATEGNEEAMELLMQRAVEVNNEEQRLR